jgi:hypothetical protein
MIWHRLRGHKIRRFTRHVDTSRPSIGDGVWIESGRIDHGRECSCGERWFLEDGVRRDRLL